MYEAANEALDTRISRLKERGVDVKREIELLASIRTRITALCLQDDYLERYRAFISSEGLPKHPSGTSNHLRDTDDKYGSGGHSFSLNREILYSYDVCGACEAHAILLSVERVSGPTAVSVENASTLKDFDASMRLENINFKKCPSY